MIARFILIDERNQSTVALTGNGGSSSKIVSDIQGGPIGFRIHIHYDKPDWLEWLIIQNNNTLEVGFTKAWDGFRNALWKNRTRETETPLAAFLELEAIKQVYLYGHKNPELISPDN